MATREFAASLLANIGLPGVPNINWPACWVALAAGTAALGLLLWYTRPRRGTDERPER